MFRFVIRRNYVDMLIGLDNKEEPQTLEQLTKESKVNYFHLTTVIRQFTTEGIVNRDQEKNVIKISLTDKGKKIASCLRELMKAIEEEPEEKESEDDDELEEED